ncbi:partitioning defective 3 homolog isoform X2 [Paramacrobiotus metropolitanus]|nr:partitioning defective 3 homolog isoform X2 [Paramacrobiotus metropolitanus]
MHLASDGMSAGSSSTDTWRPDSENSEKIGHPSDLAAVSKLTPTERWLLDRPVHLTDDQNGIEIKDDDEVTVKPGLTLSVRRGSDSNLDNVKDLDEDILIPQSQLKRWSTAAAVYGQESRTKSTLPLMSQTSRGHNLLVRPEDSGGGKSDFSAGNKDHLPVHFSQKCSSSGVKLPVQHEINEAEDSGVVGAAPTVTTTTVAVTLVPRPNEPVGLHLVPEHDIKGLKIQAIDRNSVAEATHLLHLGDYILDVNGQRVDDLDFGRAQEILRTAVAQGGAVKIRVCSTATTARAISPSSYDAVVEKTTLETVVLQQRKRTPPPLPPKPKLPYDIETMLQRANGDGGMLDYTPDVVNNDYHTAEGLYSYGSLRRPGRKLTIDLLKGPEGLGFTVTTRDNPAGSVCPIYVKSILPKGAAFKDGRLKSGDRLLEVNGQDLTGKSQDDVVGLLRGIPYNAEVVLVVGRPEATPISPVLPRIWEGPTEMLTSENKEELARKNMEILTLDVPLQDSGSAGLGIRVKGKATVVDGENRDEGIFVMNVITGGAASKDGRIQPMDQLIRINGISLLHQSNQDAMETLRKAMQEHGSSSPVMSITVAREVRPDGSAGQEEAQRFPVTGGMADPAALSHVIHVPNSQDTATVSSPHSDISPPKPPRLYQNLTSVTINGRKDDLILIEGDDSFSESVPNSAASTAFHHNRLDELKDPYDADVSMDYDPFNRESFARQSMSEKRHAHLDPRHLETYRKSKAALAHFHSAAKSHTPSPSNPAEMEQKLRRANSLESVIKGPTAAGGPAPTAATPPSHNGRRSKSSANRNRGCNESFRVAVDRSYDAEKDEENIRPSDSTPSVTFKEENIEVMDSSPSADGKKQKKPGLLRGWLRRSGNRKGDGSPVSESVVTTTQTLSSSIPVSRSAPSVHDEQAAKARQAALEEQQRINVHYQRFKSQQLQQQQKSYQQLPSVAVKPTTKKPTMPPAAEQKPVVVHIPTSGHPPPRNSKSENMYGVVTSDPYGHYMNYDEIQKVIKRRPNTHAQPVALQRQRPVSNFFEYGAVPGNGVYAHPRTEIPNHLLLPNAAYNAPARPLGQIRENSMEKLSVNRANDGVIYAAASRRGIAKPLVTTTTAAALMGSQV